MDARQRKITIPNFSWTNPQFCDPKLNRRKDDFGLTRNDRFIVWDQQKKSWKCSVRTWIERIVYHSLVQSLCPTDLSMHVVPKATTCRSVPHGHKTDVDSCSSVSTWRLCQRFTGPKGTKTCKKILRGACSLNPTQSWHAVQNDECQKPSFGRSRPISSNSFWKMMSVPLTMQSSTIWWIGWKYCTSTSVNRKTSSLSTSSRALQIFADLYK